jgi:hypothetical protein
MLKKPMLWASFSSFETVFRVEGVHLERRQIETGEDSKTKIKFQAGGLNLALPAPQLTKYFDQTPKVVAQLRSSTGRCWTSEFAEDDTSKNIPESFRAKAD